MATNEKLLGADDEAEEEAEDDEEEAEGADSSAQVSELSEALGKVRTSATPCSRKPELGRAAGRQAVSWAAVPMTHPSWSWSWS